MDDKRVYPGSQQEGEAEGQVASRRLRRQRIAAVALAAVSVVLIGASVAMFATGPIAPAELLQTTAEEPQDTGSAALADEPQEDAANDSDAAKSGDDGAPNATSASDAQADSAQASAGTQALSQGDASGKAATPGGAASTPKPDTSGSQGAQSSQGSQGSQGESKPVTTPPQPQPEPETVTVRVIVDSSRAGSPVSADQTLTFEKGATAYDAVCGLGLSVNARNSSFGIYVAGIGGLAEFDHGGESGWKYSVNGTFPNHAADKSVLSDGDVVRWVYVTAVNQE